MAADADPFHVERPEGALTPYLRAIRARPWLVLITALAAVAASVAWLQTRAESYETSAQVLVTTVGQGNPALLGLPVLTDSNESARTLQTAASIVDSPQAARVTARRTGVEDAGDVIEVQPQGDSNVLTVTATAESGALAARIANTYTRAALADRQDVLRAQVERSIEALEARRGALGAGDEETRAELAGQISQLDAIRAGRDPNFSFLQQAAAPTSPSGTPSFIIIALALIAGTVLGALAAVAVESLDRRVRDEEELLDLYPLPTLARVPPLPRGARDAVAPGLLPPKVREAFRTLQVQLGYEPGEHRAVLVTSASAGDGKTTSAINLASALAAAGRRVILLDLDLRKPDVGNRLGVHSDLMRLLRTKSRLTDVLVESPQLPSVRIMSGRPQGDVITLLEALSRRLPDLLEQARQLADYVVIDTPPLGAVSDALRLAPLVEDIVVVSRPGHTARADVRLTRELLQRMGHTPTGLLVIGQSSFISGGDAYGYAYGSDMYEVDDDGDGNGDGGGAVSSRRRRSSAVR